MTEQPNSYQVIEDNAGGIFMFWLDQDDTVVLGVENLEHANPGDLDAPTFEAVQGWEGQLYAPQNTYNSITSYAFGWQVIADQDGTYPDRMGRAGQILYQIDED